MDPKRCGGWYSPFSAKKNLHIYVESRKNGGENTQAPGRKAELNARFVVVVGVGFCFLSSLKNTNKSTKIKGSFTGATLCVSPPPRLEVFKGSTERH